MVNMFKLLKQETQFVVETHTSDFGYEDDNTYIFANEEMVFNFLKGDWDKECVDIFNNIRYMGASEYVIRIYEETEYKQKFDWEDKID